MYRYLAFAIALFAPVLASAHEVYVLDGRSIADAISSPSANPFFAYIGNEGQFLLWAAVCAVVASTVFFASIFRRFEVPLAPLFASLKRWAHPLVRVTAGACLMIYGATSSLYGPEVPLSDAFGSLSSAASILALVLGACIVVGFQTRLAALASLCLYIWSLVEIGPHMLTYAHQAGAYILLILIGGGPLTMDHRFGLGWPWRKALERLSHLAFPILRIALGLSIMYAALYAKFWHSNLALSVIEQYGLTAYFPFEPLFVVLGAFIIELLAGLMLVLGVEIRWTALFLVFWLTLGHIYFQELWWVHIPLYGYGLAILCHGYDAYTLFGRLFKRGSLEPVL